MTRRRRGYDDNVTHPPPRLRCMTTCPRSWWHRWRAHLGPASPPRTTHRAAHRCRCARPVRSCFIWRRSPWTSPSSCTSTRPVASSPRASPSTIRCSTSNLRSPRSASGRCVPDIYICVCMHPLRQAGALCGDAPLEPSPHPSPIPIPSPSPHPHPSRTPRVPPE